MDITLPPNPLITIGRAVHKNTGNIEQTIAITVAIADDLAYWLTMKAGTFQPFDDRTPGYCELANHLTTR